MEGVGLVGRVVGNVLGWEGADRDFPAKRQGIHHLQVNPIKEQ